MSTKHLPRPHMAGIDDTGDGYTVHLRDRWEISCLWCDWESAGHLRMRHAVEAYKQHEKAALDLEREGQR